MEASPVTQTAPGPPAGIEAPKRLDILIGHYDKTSDLVQVARSQRDRLFLWLLGVLVIELFAALNPRATVALTVAILGWLSRGDRGGLATQLDFGVVNLFAYALWLYLLLQYYQRTSYVRVYLRYLAWLERQVGTLLGPGLFIREGEYYRANRGRLLLNVRFFYHWLFHGFMGAVLLCRLWTERPRAAAPLPLAMYGIQLLLSVTIAYYATRYLYELRSSHRPVEPA